MIELDCLNFNNIANTYSYKNVYKDKWSNVTNISSYTIIF